MVCSLFTFLKVFAMVPDPISLHSKSLGLILLLDACAPGVDAESTSFSDSLSLTIAWLSLLRCWNNMFLDSNVSSQHPHLLLYAPTMDISGLSVSLALGSDG